jgi:hypothetical protein
MPNPKLEDQAFVFLTPEDNSSWVPSLVAFYDTHEVRWDYSYPPVTTRRTAYGRRTKTHIVNREGKVRGEEISARLLVLR